MKLPDEKTISNVRYEVSLLVDCMSALILAKALSLEQLGHDGTDVNQIAVLAANLIAVFDDGTRDRVMLRGCFVAKGKTADLEFKSIEDAFQRLKSLLTDWASEYKRLYGEDSDSGLPDPRGVIIDEACAWKYHVGQRSRRAGNQRAYRQLHHHRNQERG